MMDDHHDAMERWRRDHQQIYHPPPRTGLYWYIGFFMNMMLGLVAQ
jgi:hypothetical protein